MAYIQGSWQIVARQEIAPGMWDVTIDCPPLARLAQPGQFVHVRVEGFALRRPISICEADAAEGTLRMVFEVRGDGTRQLALQPRGAYLDMIGPLGNGFALPASDQEIVVVGGGIGVPPLLWAARGHGKHTTAIIGFRTANAAILTNDFTAHGCDLRLATDDGTAGHHGFVTDLLEQRLKQSKPALVCACGPRPMLEKTARLAEAEGVPCQVSLEERMGCGVGACLVCACKTVRDGKEIFTHVCKDGPIFNSTEVVWQ